MKKLFFFILVAIITISTSSCTNGGGRGAAIKIVKAEFTLNGKDLPSCNKPSSTTKTNDVYICRWNCADYKNQSPVTVSIDFIKDKETAEWKYFDEVIINPSKFNCIP